MAAKSVGKGGGKGAGRGKKRASVSRLQALKAYRQARKFQGRMDVSGQRQRKAETQQALRDVRQEHEEVQKALREAEEQHRQREPLLLRPLSGLGAEEQVTWKRLRSRLARTQARLQQGLARILRGTMAPEARRDLEALLYQADVGPATTERLLQALTVNDKRPPLQRLEQEVLRILSHEAPPLRIPVRSASGSAAGTKGGSSGREPCVILVVGVNGVGKTTTLGKLAAHYRGEGKKVLLVAGDTFRAAAAEQLAVWAERSGAAFLRTEAHGDPAALAYQGLVRAEEEGYDLVLCDTAGRLHTRTNLMAELQKMQRVMAKRIPAAPHETWLVLDANTGQNAILQTRTFLETVQISGLILTKLDGTARGGVLIGIANEFGLPIRFMGLGESIDDLRPFDAHLFTHWLIEGLNEAPSS